MRVKLGIVFILIGCGLISGCVLPARLTPPPPSISTLQGQFSQTLTPDLPILSPTVSSEPDPIRPILTDISPTSTVKNLPSLNLPPGLPHHFIEQLDLADFTPSVDPARADAQLQINLKSDPVTGSAARLWVYGLTAPFYTLTDAISMQDLTELWQGRKDPAFAFEKILVSPETYAAMQVILGQPGTTTVEPLPLEEINHLSLGNDPFLYVLPYEDLEPTWKVLSVDGQSPIDDNFDPQTYPLSVQFSFDSQDPDLNLNLPPENYDPSLRTTLIMTGVSALTRATAYQMQIRGNHFPGEDLHAWFTAANLLHISHEAPFASNCPPPDPNQEDLIFCSDPARIELLEFIEADIIELSGNHLLDYGVPAMKLTLEMYEGRGWSTYAGGWDLNDSREPARITHNGNQLAFLGCNSAGPYGAWASDSQPGSAPCGDYDWLVKKIQQLKSEGYLPIVTLQYLEDYTAYPSAQMELDFQRLAEAGAVVVNGSQAHTPKLMTFHQGSFLHYGLGNLFFDQMEVYYNGVYLPGTRDEFLDRLIFDKGRLISVELLTAKLEDYAKPRPMTDTERATLLSRIFDLARQTNEER